jgi:hypothetical protein
VRQILRDLYRPSQPWREATPFTKHAHLDALAHNLALDELLAEMEATAVKRIATVDPHDQQTRLIEWAMIAAIDTLRARIMNDRDRYGKEARQASMPNATGS